MMNIWGLTDIGLVRKENQDAYEVRSSAESGHTVCVVCDGMGGPKGGRLAGKLAVKVFMDSCLANLAAGMSEEQVREVAAFSVSAANRVIHERAEEESGLRGMGTTLVSAIIWDDRALLTNVGDSRGYLIRSDAEDRGLRRITRDHSVVEQLVERGDITPEEARRHPDRNLITRAIGPDESVESDSYSVALRSGDFLLLCTDGLVDTTTDREIEREVLQDHSGSLNRLLEIAKLRGAADNITAVLMQQL